MQSSRSLGGMTSSNANLPFPMPTYDMNHLQSLAPQALALSLGAFGTDPSLRSISQNPIPAPTYAPSDFQSTSEDTLCVSPQLIMDPLANGHNSEDQVGASYRRQSSRPSPTSLNYATTMQRQSSQSQTQQYDGASPSGQYSTHSSPLANRSLDVTLSPALEIPYELAITVFRSVSPEYWYRSPPFFLCFNTLTPWKFLQSADFVQLRYKYAAWCPSDVQH